MPEAVAAFGDDSDAGSESDSSEDSFEGDVEAWVQHELTTGDKVITKKEAEKFFSQYAKNHGIELTPAMKDQLDAGFDMADTNHDGVLDL